MLGLIRGIQHCCVPLFLWRGTMELLLTIYLTGGTVTILWFSIGCAFYDLDLNETSPERLLAMFILWPFVWLFVLAVATNNTIRYLRGRHD